MRYWWVNQNQTYRHEVTGGYLWSPKRKSNGGINPFYESMREVAPRDIVLSFAESRIAAIGIARSHCYECPKPREFGSAGMNWNDIGWKVEVKFTELGNRIRPADHIEILRPRLPKKYSPLLPDGRRSQSVYLAEIPPVMFEALRDLIGSEAHQTLGVAETWNDLDAANDTPLRDLSTWEDHVRESIEGGRYDSGDPAAGCHSGSTWTGDLQAKSVLRRTEVPHYRGRQPGTPSGQPL